MNKFNSCIIIIFLSSIVPSNVVFANNYSSIYYTITSLLGNKVPAIKVKAEIRGDIRDQLIGNSRQFSNVFGKYQIGKSYYLSLS